MKKLLFLLTVALFATTYVMAEDISAEQALQIAKEFAASPSTQKIARRSAPMNVSPMLAYTIKSKATGKDNVYAVNLGDDQGFVIVSGESSADAYVLGYCDHGSFSFDDAPIQLKDLLGYYSEAIDSLRQNPALTVRRRAVEGLASWMGSLIVGPLLTTTWNQCAPYNNYCPEGCPTGCVITAVSQVMNYWKWPKAAMGEMFENDSSSHVYDWDNMRDDYFSGYNTAEADAVARLMADVGKAFGAEYSPEKTPASFTDYPLSKYFSYEPGSEMPSATKAKDLQSTIQSELDALRPVLYAGYPNTPADGHALVIDGYTSGNYFHYNYWWGGAYDGFYKISLSMYPNNAQIMTKVRPYDAVHKVVDDIDYALMKNGEAHIFNYLKENVKDEVLEIPATVTGDDGQIYKVTRICQSAFYQKGHFSQFTMGENIEAIDAFSFFYTNIDKLVLSDKMKVVPDQAFLNTKVKSLVIGKNIKRIGKKAFYMCDLSEVTSKSPAFDVDDEAFFATRPDGGEWIGCIISLGKSAFGAARFTDADKQPHFTHLETIDDMAFNGTYFAKGRVYFNSTLKYISPTALKDAYGPYGNVEFDLEGDNPYFTIGPGGLYNKNMTSLILTNGIKSPIGIDLVKFPESLVRLERGSITSRPHAVGTHYYDVGIPATIIEMEGAFAYCETLGDVTCLHTIPPVITDSTFNDKIFENSPNITLYVPEGTEELYINAPGWRKFPNIIGDQEYVPIQDQDRQYNMVVNSTDENGSQRVNIPVGEVASISLSNDGQQVVISRNGKDDIVRSVTALDSISWIPGFVYENAEVFDLNDSTLTVEAQKCSVTFDATVIDEDVQLCVRNLVLSPKVSDDVVRGFAVDLSLSDGRHELTGTADITIPVSVGPNERVCAAYFNETEGQWEPVYFRYDKSLGKVTISTDHLSTYSLFYLTNEFSNVAKLYYYEAIPELSNFNEATKILLDIVSSEDPDKEMVRKFKDDMALWQSVGLDGFYNGIVSVTEPLLDFKPEAIDHAVTAMSYIGTFMNILDVVGADIRGDDVGVAAGTLNTILGYTTNQLAAAIGTPIMSASMSCVAFIGIALNKFGTMTQERVHDLAYGAYHYYYSKNGKWDGNVQSCYRSPKDWYLLLYPVFAEGKMTKEQLETYIEAEVRKYCDEIWNISYETWSALCHKSGFWTMYSTVPDLTASLKDRLSKEHFAELMEGDLTSVIRGIKSHLTLEANKRRHNAMEEMGKVVNTEINLRFKDSSQSGDEISKYAGWSVRFTDAAGLASNPDQFKSQIREDGTGTLLATVYSLIENHMRTHITLTDPENVDQKVFEFDVPDDHGQGKVFITIDLDKGGMKADTQPLEGLELTYDPNTVTYPQDFGEGTESDEHQVVCYLYLNNLVNKRARFQTAVEQFFNRHNFITVDEYGNFKIGDDIMGAFVDNGLQATGKFIIDVSHKFVEQTKQQYVNDMANPTDKYMLGLLDGIIQHKIECEYKITRASVDSKEYEVSYSGIGNYALLANVITKIAHADWEPMIHGESQKITIQDLTTGTFNYDGAVTLKYSTTLK